MGESFGQYLRNLRKQAGLTLKELGMSTDLSYSYLSQLERGERGGVKKIPSPEILKKLHKPLGVRYAELMVKAGHMKYEDLDDYLLGEEPELDDESKQMILMESMEKKERIERKIREIEEIQIENKIILKALERDLEWVLNRSSATYKGIPIDDNDRYDIRKFLEYHFHERTAPDKSEWPLPSNWKEIHFPTSETTEE
ncbi:helix-turn-helix domain-containing protein [Cohnella fermenti]|uniref:helix-turn-helix domain-containing protein n=1 Tax=Cohnella fermenti TaxID=2565925 RepID=UPI001454DDB7|nr:helix-turn-helix transcriptional regulator [Cohnella fermenti]